MTDPRVTGVVRYSQDVAMEGMLHARLVRSPVAHGRVVGVDASAVPEGIIVLLAEDVRDLGSYGPQIKDQEILPQERVRYAGDVVAAVAAETLEEAEEAVGLIDVEYEELPAVFDEVESASEEAPLVHETINISKNDAAYFGIRPQQGTNICHRFRLRHGDVEAGFGEADAVVEETYHTAGGDARPDGAPRRRCPLGWGPVGGHDRHADPVQHAHGPRRALRHRRGEGQDNFTPYGGLVRGEDLRQDGGDSRVPRSQGEEAGQDRSRAR